MNPALNRIFRLGMCALIAASCAKDKKPPSSTARTELRLVTDSAATVHATHAVDAPVLSTVKFGTVLTSTGVTTDTFDIFGRRGPWYLVKVGTTGQGWIFGAATIPYDMRWPHQAFEPLISKALSARPLPSFAELVRLEKAFSDAPKAGGLGRTEFLRLQLIDAIAGTLNVDHELTESEKRWTESHATELRQGEFSLWAVNDDAYDDLLKKYPELANNEEVIWHIAQPVSAHCEGEAACMLLFVLDSYGSYLVKYPRGVHADSALRRLYGNAQLSAQYACTSDGPGTYVDSALVARTHAVIDKTTSILKDSIRMQLDSILRKCSSFSPPVPMEDRE